MNYEELEDGLYSEGHSILYEALEEQYECYDDYTRYDLIDAIRELEHQLNCIHAEHNSALVAMDEIRETLSNYLLTEEEH